MAHFAKLDENNIVVQVLVVNNDWVIAEEAGLAFLEHATGFRNWKQTSYNCNFRKNFAGIGYTYDKERDAFIPPKPDGVAVILDEQICRWKLINLKDTES